MKAETPDNPELGCSASARPLCRQDNTPVRRRAGEAQPKAPRRTKTLQLLRHGLSRRFSPASPSGVVGLNPGHLPVSPSCPPPTPSKTSPSTSDLLPGHTPPPLANSHNQQLPRAREQQHRYRPRQQTLRRWMRHQGGTWKERHTDRGQKSHQIIGKQRACNNEKRTDLVTNHFFL